MKPAAVAFESVRQPSVSESAPTAQRLPAFDYLRVLVIFLVVLHHAIFAYCSGGENVYPREIEEFLYRHPAIQDVQVIGVPDPKYGEELCAWVRLKPGQTLSAEDLRAFCQGQIAHYKIPRYVKFVDAFPMTVTGKIQKFEMRKAMIAELSLAEEKTA